MSFDLVIRGGVVVDGSGGPSYRADVGVAGGRVVELGRIGSRGTREISAEGKVVTPGFVDGHTHMDAQVWWDPLGTSSCWHGVTSVVMGHCGFSLAPVRAGEEHLAVRNLERAEAIPREAMEFGIEWRWERFAEHLDALDGHPMGINHAVNVGHSALRTWAMGERAFTEPAGPDDLAAMARELTDALDSGAVGFTTSRSPSHETADDRPVASRLAEWSEVQALVRTMARRGRAVFQMAQEPDARTADPATRDRWQQRVLALTIETGVPTTWGIVAREGAQGDVWLDELAFLDRAAAAGADAFGLVQVREISLVLSFRTHLPFDSLPEWRSVRTAPLAEQARLLRDPEVRRRLIAAADAGPYGPTVGAQPPAPDYDWIRLLDAPLPPYRTVAEVARERGVHPVALMIDSALASDMDQLFLQVLANQDQDKVASLMRHPHTAVTFSDSGAHVTQIMDSSLPTYLLSHWTRERQAFGLAEAVRLLTSDVADRWGLADRGVVRVGAHADLNVIDPEVVAPSMPEVRYDLPGGAARLAQGAVGIDATVVGGDVLMVGGEDTGARPGRLLRRTS